MYTWADFAPFIAQQGTLIPGLIVVATAIIFLLAWQNTASPQALFWILTTSLTLFYGIIIVRQIDYRIIHRSNLPQHDGAVQSEIAAEMVLEGKNPYQEDFSQTRMSSFISNFSKANNLQPPQNLAWQHYAYPPLTFLTLVPIAAFHKVSGFPLDLRFFSSFLFLVLVALFARLGRSWEEKMAIVAALVAIPGMTLYLVAGFNDVEFVVTVLLAGLAWQKKHSALTALALAAACGFKQLAWPIALLWLVMSWKLPARERKRAWLVFAFSSALWFLPYILWDPMAIYQDIIQYVSGSLYGAYAISGLTIMQFLYRLMPGLDPYTLGPFWIGQSIVGLIVFSLAIPRLWRRPTATHWLAWSTILLLSVAMVSRFHNDNYLASTFLLFLGLAVLGWAEREHDHAISEK